jgi:RNA binding exosome subunit
LETKILLAKEVFVRMDFSSVTVTLFVHSTEDEDLLMKSITEKFGLQESEITREKISGHYGNEIISIRAHIIGARANDLANRILASLSSAARLSVHSEIERSLDEHDSLFFRLDRQTLGGSSISLSDDEPIKIKFKPKNRSGGRKFMKEQYEELMS